MRLPRRPALGIALGGGGARGLAHIGVLKVLGVASALAVLYVVAAVVGPWLVDADRFRPRVESRLTGTLGRKVTLGRLSLSLWTGVELVADGLTIGDPPASEPGAGLTMAAGRVSVRPAFLALLRGDVRPRSVALDRGSLRTGGRLLADRLSAHVRLGRAGDGLPRLDGRLSGALRAVPGGSEFRATFDATLLPDRLRLASLRVEAGSGRIAASGEVAGISTGHVRVSVHGEADVGRTHFTGSLSALGLGGGRPEFEFEVASPLVDFDDLSRLAGVGRPEPRSAGVLDGLFTAAAAAEPPPPPAGLLSRAVCRGTIEATRGRVAGLEITGLHARVNLEGGIAKFEDATFALYGGTHRGTLDLDLVSKGAPFRLSARLDGVDAERLLKALAPSRGGAIHGLASVTLDVAGNAAGTTVAGWIRGSARAELRDGRFVTVGILKQVAQLLEMAGGRGIGRDETPFDHVSASFDVRDGRADTKDLEFRSADLDLDGGGSVGLDGSLRLDVTASFSKSASADLVRETPQLEFRLDPGGRLTMPLKIRGDLKAPLVQLDLDRVLREGLERSSRDRGRKGLLRRLLGGN
jgi:hypothetical protein